jgi:PleD family two-component response regulator
MDDACEQGPSTRHDQLTGLANPLQFTQALRAAISGARQREEQVTLFYGRDVQDQARPG